MFMFLQVDVCVLFRYRENMPSHFKFKEYCPLVFRNLRERFGIDDQDFQVNAGTHSKGETGAEVRRSSRAYLVYAAGDRVTVTSLSGTNAGHLQTEVCL